MKIKTADLIDAPLDWAVAKAQGREEIRIFGRTCPMDRGWIEVRFNPEPRAGTARFDPSTNWSQGGPIIEHIKGFALKHWLESESEPETCYGAHILNHEGYWAQLGPTPLIAAMRCFVTSKLGDKVDIPKELLK